MYDGYSQVFFSITAVKCNDNLLVIEVLAALGTGFDCASKVSTSFISLSVFFILKRYTSFSFISL